MPNYYTRKGDDGTSGLLGNARVPKNHPRMETVGTIDEANAALGLTRSISQDKFTQEVIIAIQRDLYKIMAEVAATPENAATFREIDESRTKWLEDQIEKVGGKIQIPKEFIIPGDTKTGATLGMARTIIRRAERRLSGLYHQGDLDNQEILRYINRLSSLCFILELWENQVSGDFPVTLAKDTHP
jgi:cob(I)alamin adenosyltransferase